MLFSTPTQFAVLALVLVAGWLLGLASHPGGRKWKARYIAERDAHAAERQRSEAAIAEARRNHDTAVAEARRDHDAAIAEANRRHAELERDHARLAKAAPFTAATVQRQTVARPAYPAGERRGWFDWGDRRVR